MKKNTKGFTLIELLVVIAIIGILASVVLVNLNDARGKGTDAKVKTTLSNVRSAAELIADGGSYGEVCTAGSQAAVMLSSLGVTTACVDASTAWAASAVLSTGSYWCVDSTGAATSTSAANTTTSC